jgi:hypothetical protein
MAGPMQGPMQASQVLLKLPRVKVHANSQADVGRNRVRLVLFVVVHNMSAQGSCHVSLVDFLQSSYKVPTQLLPNMLLSSCLCPGTNAINGAHQWLQAFVPMRLDDLYNRNK